MNIWGTIQKTFWEPTINIYFFEPSFKMAGFWRKTWRRDLRKSESQVASVVSEQGLALESFA